MPLAVRILIAIVACLALYLIAVRVIRLMMAPAPPEEPDVSTLVPVDHRYRCMVCGTEVTMTAAPGDEPPDPPRHCRDDMVLVGPRSLPS